MKDFADKAFDMIEQAQKRIAELDRAWNSAQDRIAKLEEALTIERQRREECEAIAKDLAESLEPEPWSRYGIDGDIHPMMERQFNRDMSPINDLRAYFARYASKGMPS